LENNYNINNPGFASNISLIYLFFHWRPTLYVIGLRFV